MADFDKRLSEALTHKESEHKKEKEQMLGRWKDVHQKLKKEKVDLLRLRSEDNKMIHALQTELKLITSAQHTSAAATTALSLAVQRCRDLSNALSNPTATTAADCPTIGGGLISIFGGNFLTLTGTPNPPTTVSASVQFNTSTLIVVTLPAGTGSNILVSVGLNGAADTYPGVSYAVPVITSLKGLSDRDCPGHCGQRLCERSQLDNRM